MSYYTSYNVTYVLRVAGLAAAYYAASKLGFTLAVLAEQVTAVWPPTGISLAALLLLGPRMWPGVFVGAFLTNITAHEPVLTALVIAVGNTLEALAGAWILRRCMGDDPESYLLRVRGVICLIFFAAALSTAISATIGTAALCLSGLQSWSLYMPLWFTWWLGDASGALIVAPLLIAWAYGPYRLSSRSAALEVLLLTVVVAAANVFIFIMPVGPEMVQSYPYMMFPIVIWTAISFGARGVTTVTFALSVVAIWATAGHRGPFAGLPPESALNVLQTFTIITAITGLTMSAAVSERRESEKVESQSRRRLDAILENIVDGLITIDGRGIVRSYNKACTRIFGYTADEVVGRNVKMLMPPEHSENHDGYIRNYTRTGRAKIIGIGRELEGLRKDGTRFPMDLSVAEVKTEHGDRLFSGIIRDISERRLAEKRLHAAHQFQQDVLNHIPDPIFMKDRQHRWIGGNKSFWEFMNGPPEKFIGKSDYEFFPKSEADAFWEKDDRVFNSGEVDMSEEFFTDARGVRHVLSTKKVSFLNEEGEPFWMS